MSGPIDHKEACSFSAHNSAVSKQVIATSQHVEDAQNTIIRIGDAPSQDAHAVTQPPTAKREEDRSSPRDNDGTPQDTDVPTRLQDVRKKLFMPSISWYKKRRLMEKTDEYGMCPVHLAAMEGYHDIIEEFMELMPNCVDIRSKEGKTALHYAVKYGQLEAVKMLLKNSKDVWKMMYHDCDNIGNTALHLAVIHEADTQIVRELLKQPGLNVNAVNKAHMTALDIAAHSSTVSSQGKCAEIKTMLEAVKDCGRYATESEGKSKIVDVDTVVASLIASITFAAIFQIPGGIEDNKNSSLHGGARKLSAPVFLWFSICNTFALFTSLTVVIMWLLRERLPRVFEVAYVSALYLGFSIMCTGLPFLCAYILIVTPFTDAPQCLRKMCPHMISSFGP